MSVLGRHCSLNTSWVVLSCIVLPHKKLSLDPTRGLTVLMSEYICFFLRRNLLCEVLVRVLKTGDFTVLLRAGGGLFFLFASLLINVCISGETGTRLAFIETCHVAGRMLVWEYGLHPPLIPGRSLNVLTGTDS